MRLFYFEKLQNQSNAEHANGMRSDDDTDLESNPMQDNFKELSEKWGKLSDKDKSDLLKEYQTVSEILLRTNKTNYILLIFLLYLIYIVFETKKRPNQNIIENFLSSLEIYPKVASSTTSTI